MFKLINKILILIFAAALFQSCENKKLLKIQEEFIKRGPIVNTNNPQILYWFITQESLEHKQYLNDIEYIANHTPFDMVVLTQRETISFYDYDKMYPVFQELVTKAHKLGIKVVLQLWPKNFDSPSDKSQGIIVEKEIAINGKREINYTASSNNVRYAHDVLFESPNNKEGFLAPHPLFASPPLYSEVFDIYIFKKNGEGVYKKNSLTLVPKEWITIANKGKEQINLNIKIPKEYRDYALYITTVHYHQYGDLFSDYFPELFKETFKFYDGIPFDGGGLDEFKYMPINRIKGDDLFRERMYSKHMAKYMFETMGKKLEDIIFKMRYAPEDKPEHRIEAINMYFETLRQGPLIVEKAFNKLVKQRYGRNAFVGLHNTFHNQFENDEIWATGINWWSIPRDYGQTDERTIYPVRMGVACANSNPVTYNMYYSKKAKNYYDEAIYAARYNVRIHYHAYNDLGVWGLDFREPEFNKNINNIEACLELLDNFNPPYPKMDLLVVFGLPEQVNWLPNMKDRNAYDIKKGLDVLNKSKKIWDLGYTSALAPSYEITSGKISLNSNNRISYGGKEFNALIYLNPEYLLEDNLVFLKKYVNNGGKLMLEGNAKMTFNGNDIEKEFQKIKDKAIVKELDFNRISELGVFKNDLEEGVRYVDGSVVLTDRDAIMNQKPKTFNFTINNDAYEVICNGFLALKTNQKGDLEKLSVNNFKSLSKNGEQILMLTHPSSIVFSSKSKINFLIEDANLNNHITFKH